MRAPWTPPSDDKFGGTDTIEEDNEQLVVKNKIYKESKDCEEANARIEEALGI